MIVYVSKGEKKGAIVERFNRTLKSRLEMMFTETGKHVWVDTLDYFIANYNDTYHRSIKMAPSSVTLDNQNEVFETLYPKTEKQAHCDFKINDRVRIAIQKNLFDKGYIKSLFRISISTFAIYSDWSNELYKIKSVEKSINQICYYRVEPIVGEDSTLKKNTFYGPELNLVARIK